MPAPVPLPVERAWRRRLALALLAGMGGMSAGLPGAGALAAPAPASAPAPVPQAAPASPLAAAADWVHRNGAREVVLVTAAPGEAPRVASVLPDGAGSEDAALHRLFQIGSQTKWFTAAAILLLERDGKLRLDDPATRYLPGLPDGEGVTIRQLLTHSSGLGDAVSYLEAEGQIPGGHVRFADLMALSRVKGRQFARGERFAYNNYGFDVLGEIVRRVSGESRAAYLRRRVLGPLGMTETWFGAEEVPPAAARAVGYQWDGTAPRDMSDPYPLEWAGAAGDMVSSAHDLLLWLAALQDPGNPTGLTLGDFTAFSVVAGGQVSDMPDYGLGIMHRIFMGRPTWGHGGLIHGYITYCGIEEKSKTRFILLTADMGEDSEEPVHLQAAFQPALGLALWTAGAPR